MGAHDGEKEAIRGSFERNNEEDDASMVYAEIENLSS